jgi:predicted short-subunit dehydrogenase-like oxidoreductase (DUF2520 family)
MPDSTTGIPALANDLPRPRSLVADVNEAIREIHGLIRKGKNSAIPVASHPLSALNFASRNSGINDMTTITDLLIQMAAGRLNIEHTF